MSDQPIEEKLMIEVTIGQDEDGPVVVVAHGKLEKPAEATLHMAAAGLSALLHSGWSGRIWIDPAEGHIRLNRQPRTPWPATAPASNSFSKNTNL